MSETEQTFMDSPYNKSLAQILQKGDLNLDSIFSIKDILTKIKRQMKIFIDYCKMNEGFTLRMIQLGLKTPTIEGISLQLKNLIFISSDILTSDHEYIAHLLIMSNDNRKFDSDDEDEIAQQIETEENTHEIAECDKYKYLESVLNYISGKDLEENCINYIMKCLEILVRKKLNEFLQYFSINPQMLDKIVQISHFPSVAHLLAKMLTDDEDDMTPLAIEAKHRIIPLLLQKIHNEIQSPLVPEVLQCIQEVLNSSRYGDSQDRSILQKMSDSIVAQTQINFHMESIQNQSCQPNQKSFNKIFNSITYLSLVLTRMSMDQQSDYPQENRPYKPTLKYSEQSIFPSFCKLVSFVEPFQLFKLKNPSNFKLVYIKLIDLLVTMTKHSYFGQYYSSISKQGRINAIKILVSSIANRKLSGILLQITSSLLQKIIISQQKISESNPESPNKVSPSELYKIISQHYLSINELTKSIMQETSKQRNKNEQGIYLRKLLVVLDNFFKNKQIQKGFSELEAVSKLFPAFNLYNCKKFTDLTVVVKHPAYTKAKTPQQFVFIERNRNYLSKVTAEQIQNSKIIAEKQIQQQLAFIINSNKQQILNKTEQKQIIDSPTKLKQIKVGQLSGQKQVKVESPTRLQVAPQPCLLFFIRYLAIY